MIIILFFQNKNRNRIMHVYRSAAGGGVGGPDPPVFSLGCQAGIGRFGPPPPHSLKYALEPLPPVMPVLQEN